MEKYLTNQPNIYIYIYIYGASQPLKSEQVGICTKSSAIKSALVICFTLFCKGLTYLLFEDCGKSLSKV